jgi:hypothetical protein
MAAQRGRATAGANARVSKTAGANARVSNFGLSNIIAPAFPANLVQQCALLPLHHMALNSEGLKKAFSSLS